jgi:putative nucleotidyltransferase with HDIG domain
MGVAKVRHLVRDPQRDVYRFVAGVSVVSLVSASLLVADSPALPPGALTALSLLSLLAIIGEAWAFLLPQSATTSIAFIPYMAMALVVPHWATVIAIALLRGADEIRRRTSLIKATFNLAQFVLVFSLTISTYLILGGKSFLLAPTGIAAVTRLCGWAALGAYALSVAVNISLTSMVIARSSGRSVNEVWKENHAPSLGLDLIAAPVTFGFAYVYTNFGPIAAALLWVPLVGFRHWAKTTVDLAQTNRELLELMIKSIEARDPYTSGHSRRVSQYATIIARALRLGEREIEKIGTAALLHDVGKIHEKYGPILRKTDKLTLEEWAVMKEHPADGAELVATMTRLTEFVPAIRHHHERWSGAGYPDGISGDAIPLASRIIMVADTIDAMTTVRPYRGALSEADVQAELIKLRGDQFDPTIVDALLASAEWRQIFTPSHRNAQTRGLSLLRVVGSD